MEKYYTLQIGYSGADISDIATIIDVEASKTHWLVGIILNGFEKQDVTTGFVKVIGKDERNWETFDRRRPISYGTDLREPKTRDD